MRKPTIPRRFRWHSALAVVLGLGAVLLMALSGATSADASHDVIVACADRQTGVLRIGQACGTGDTALSWSRSGETGADGPEGPVGPSGFSTYAVMQNGVKAGDFLGMPALDQVWYSAPESPSEVRWVRSDGNAVNRELNPLGAADVFFDNELCVIEDVFYMTEMTFSANRDPYVQDWVTQEGQPMPLWVVASSPGPPNGLTVWEGEPGQCEDVHVQNLRILRVVPGLVGAVTIEPQ